MQFEIHTYAVIKPKRFEAGREATGARENFNAEKLRQRLIFNFGAQVFLQSLLLAPSGWVRWSLVSLEPMRLKTAWLRTHMDASFALFARLSIGTSVEVEDRKSVV